LKLADFLFNYPKLENLSLKNLIFSIKLLHCFAQIVHLTFTGKLTNLIAIDLMREFAEAEEEEGNDYNQLGEEIKEVFNF